MTTLEQLMNLAQVPDAFVVAFDSESDATETEIMHFLNARPEVVNWTTGFAYFYVVVAKITAAALSNALIEYFKKNHGRTVRFMVIPVTDNRVQGFMPKIAWNTIVSATEPRALQSADDEIPF